MGELINLTDYRDSKDDEFIALMFKELRGQMPVFSEDEVLYYGLVDMGICPCCGRHFPEDNGEYDDPYDPYDPKDTG